MDNTARGRFPVVAYILTIQRLIRSLAQFFSQSVMGLYLRNKLLFTPQEVGSLEHTRGTMNTFFMPLGALFASSLLSRYFIMIIGTALFASGELVLFIASMPERRKRFLVYIFWVIDGIGLFIAGGAFNAFVGDQFKLPEQHDQLLKFNGLLYVLHNFSIFLAHFIRPLVRTHVSCFGEKDCYSMSIGISAVLYFLEIIVYLMTAKYFVSNVPTYGIMVNCCGCMCHGLKQWLCERKINPRQNWLDHAEPKYGAQLVEDIKRFFRILLFIATFLILFAIHEKMHINWSFQATRMDGRISATSFTITPDHHQLLGPLLVMVLTPLITVVLDPITSRWGFEKTMRRIILGMGLIALSSAMAGFLESYLKQTYPKALRSDESELRIFNGLDCRYIIRATGIGNIEMHPLGVYTKKHIPVHGQKSIQLSSTDNCTMFSEDINLEGGKAISVSVQQNKDGTIGIVSYEEIVQKSESGFPVISVLGLDASDSLAIVDSEEEHMEMQPDANNKPRSSEVAPDTYTVILNGRKIMSRLSLLLGGVYVASVVDNDSISLHEIVEPNSVHILWICPQVIVFRLGEIYQVAATMTFLYAEAPISLKQVVFATYGFAHAMGEDFVIYFMMFESLEQDHNYYLTALVMALDTAVLLGIALCFKPLDLRTEVI